MIPYKSKFQENDEEIERLKREIKAQKDEQLRLEKETEKIRQDSIKTLKYILSKVKTEEEEANVLELINEMEKKESSSEEINKRIDIMIKKIIDNWGNNGKI
jgi:type II restriction/modification system DNA methylase subunit YeeA